MSSLPIHHHLRACEPQPDRQPSGTRRITLWLYIPSLAVSASNPALPEFPPSLASHYALVTEASTLASPSPSQPIALCVTSSGKPMQRPLSWRGWQTRPWSQRLSGTICDPLTAEAGAAAFISSLPVIPASHSVMLGSGAARPTRVTFGPKSRASLLKSSRRLSLPKMSKATSIWDLPKSSKAFGRWATAQKRDCLRREKLAQATGVADYSSWPTPTATDAGYLPDLMVGAGIVQPRSPFDVVSTSSGQYSLSNAARSWTKLWSVIQAMGMRPTSWMPVTPSPSSHQVRVSFRLGKGSYIDTLVSNPRFFELVMGWPIGWTAPGEPVTGFAAWLRQSRIQHSKLISNANGGQQHD